MAQTVVAMYLGERAEPRFHPYSYGYRPAKSALDALSTCGQRCWSYGWVIDPDVANNSASRIERRYDVGRSPGITDSRAECRTVRRDP